MFDKKLFAWSDVSVTLKNESDTAPLAQGATQGWMDRFEITATGYGVSECHSIKLYRGTNRILHLSFLSHASVAIEGDVSVGAGGVLEVAGDQGDLQALIHVGEVG